ncbi:MAG: ABC transporter ATP-binding protein [Candidatus Dormiibacterota bacterium]
MSGETPGTTPTVLEVAGIDVRFEGVVALDGVSLTVRANQIVGVIGPNGAGKTTLFNAVSRFVTPVAGTITYQGRSLLGLPTWRLAHMGIARTLQGVGLWPTLTVLDNVVAGSPSRTRLTTDLLAFPGADRHTASLRKEALANLDELGVVDRAGAYPGALPHGVQKRVIIARALMARPSLLLLDEPASGLSASDVNELIDLLRSLRTRMAIALVEHHVDMVMAVSDTIIVLNLGQVIASGTPAEIRANSDVANAYLGQTVAHA